MPRTNRLSAAADYLRSLLTNMYFWAGLAGLIVIAVGLYILLNAVIMPSYTRQGASVTVPDVMNQPFEQARMELESRDLVVERITQRYNPNFPQDVVIDQNPVADAMVKPGRNVYLTVNSGDLQMVRVPSVKDLSLREAINRLRAHGLQVEETLPDSIPAPNRNTVTRQRPAAGDSLSQGSNVTLWYSTGLGEEYVQIPDVTGMTVEEAQGTLLEALLRSIVIRADEDEDVADEIVRRQSRDPGTSVPAGFEVRLYLDEEAPAPPEE